MRRFARWLAENPYLVLAASLAITVWLGFYAWQIKIESALDTVLPRGDPAVAYYDEIRSTFGSDDVGVVGVHAGNERRAALREAGLEGGDDAAVRHRDDPDARVGRRRPRGDGAGVVVGPVVDDDAFPGTVGLALQTP